MSHQDHPERTPVYGALLMVAAMPSGVLVTYWVHPPQPVRVIVLVAALLGRDRGSVHDIARPAESVSANLYSARARRRHTSLGMLSTATVTAA